MERFDNVLPETCSRLGGSYLQEIECAKIQSMGADTEIYTEPASLQIIMPELLQAMPEVASLIGEWIVKCSPHKVIANEAKGKGAFVQNDSFFYRLSAKHRLASEMPVCSAAIDILPPPRFTREKRFVEVGASYEDHYFFYEKGSDLVVCINPGLFVDYMGQIIGGLPGERIAYLRAQAKGNTFFVDINAEPNPNRLAENQTFLVGTASDILQSLKINYLGQLCGDWDPWDY